MRRLEDESDLVRFLAGEHLHVLRNWRPAAVVYTSEPDPMLNEIIEREKAAEHAEYLERLKNQKPQPNYNWWQEISKTDLEKLVWIKPTIEIAKDYDVSDVAVAKKCKAWGISKPPRGFWAEVKAGKWPHPGGIRPKGFK